MEIQRQSDYYSLDRPEIHHANLTAEQISDFTKGVGIPTGTMNTRIASRHMAVDHSRPPYDRSPIEREQIQAIMDDYDLSPEEAVQEYERRNASRLAWREGEEWTYAPENFTPDESDEYDWTNEDIEDEEALESLDNHIPEDLVADNDYHRRANQLMADPGVGGMDAPQPDSLGGSVSMSLPGAMVKMIDGGSTMTGQEDTPAFNPGPRVGAHDPAPWLLPDYEEEDEDDLEEVPLEVPVGRRYSPEALIDELVRRQIHSSEIDNQLLQAEGEEIEGIGMYNQFLEDAQDAGDEHAEAVIGEALQDEYDHVNNFANALKGREAVYRQANPALRALIPMVSEIGQDAANEFGNEGAKSKAALDEAVASERYL